MTPYTREQLIQKASLTSEDMAEVIRCRRKHNRLGFAYQIMFVRLFNRLPSQQPLEIDKELLQFAAMQVGIDAGQFEEYAMRQHTVSDHQARVQDYLGLHPLDWNRQKF